MKLNEVKEMWRGEWLTACPGKTEYETKKGRLRYIATEWQYEFAGEVYSWLELCEVSLWFENKAKQYGLLREFRENGIC